MCRPTKRPKAVMAVYPSAPNSEAEQVVAPGEPGKELDTFVFDLKGDADLFGINDLWQAEISESETEVQAVETHANPMYSKTEESAESRPKTFVYTAFDMVSDIKNLPIIGFSEDGLIIEIRDLELLAEKILPAYFRHRNVTSFYRQLNSYGFRTTRSSSREVVHAFSHDLFRKDRPDLLSNIFRKKCLKRQARIAAKKEEEALGAEMPPTSPVSMSSSSDESAAPQEVAEIKRKVVREAPSPIDVLRDAEVKAAERARILEEKNRRLREENRSILSESEVIFNSMNQLVDIQTDLIQRLFGREAAIAFAEQSKPFRMSGEPAAVAKAQSLPSNVQASAKEYEEFQGDTEDMMFADDELEMLENIFRNDVLIA